MTSWQLVISLTAGALWSVTLYRLLTGWPMTPLAAGSLVVAFVAMLIILPFGSLRIMGILTDEQWFVTGTLLRGAVLVAGVAALLERRR
jgi:hypothetical protein